MAKALFTFGYEGLSINAFIARLRTSGIRTVLDVRELPLSRKRGFSKRAFAEALQAAGIVYTHLPALGCPKIIRNRYKVDHDWVAYSRAFNAYIGDQGEVMAELAKIAHKTNTCLVCFEADFNRCHRSIVARVAARAAGLRVTHLTATATIPDVSVRAVA